MTLDVTAFELMKFCPFMTFCTSALSLAMPVVPYHGASGAWDWPVGDVVLFGPVATEEELPDVSVDAAEAPYLLAK